MSFRQVHLAEQRPKAWFLAQDGHEGGDAGFGGRMRIIAAIHTPEAIRRILDCLGLPFRPPPVLAAEAVADPYDVVW